MDNFNFLQQEKSINPFIIDFHFHIIMTALDDPCPEKISIGSRSFSHI